MKKFFAIIMSVLMIACFMPTMAFAARSTAEIPTYQGTTVSFTGDNTVFWTAGGESGYTTTLEVALTAAYKANKGDITIVCKENANVGTMTHGHVADSITIYGNGAYISDGECDLEVDTYKYSRETGTQADGGSYLDKNITITAYQLDNLGVWSQRHTGYEININLIDCDGKKNDGKDTNAQRVYLDGTGNNATNNITLTDCDFITAACPVKSDANGTITVTDCTFTNVAEPINLKHDGSGSATYVVKGCKFTNCGSTGEDKDYAAPIRFVDGSDTGSVVDATVENCSFSGTIGTNGDILIGDGRHNKSNDREIKLTVQDAGSSTNVMAQKSAYYNAEKTIANNSKAETVTVEEGAALNTSWKKMFAAVQMGNEYYESIATAISDVENGATITLLKDVTDSITIPEDKTVTLNLNNCKITTSTGCAIVNKGNLTVTGTGNVSTSASGSAAIANFPNAVANVNGGTYISEKWYVIKNMGTMTIDGVVKVKKPEGSTDTSSLIDNGWVAGADTVAGESVTAEADKAKLTIKNGEFNGKAGAKSCSVVKNDDYGVLTISGGTFDSTNNKGSSNATTVLNWNKATISGGTFIGQYPISNGAYNNEADKGNITITGGKFTGTNRIFGMSQGGNGKGEVTVAGGSFTAPAIGGDYANETGGYKLSITGGTFSTSPKDSVAEGKNIYKYSDSEYVVAESEPAHTVGKNTWTKNSDGIYEESYVSRGSSGSSSSSTTTTTDTVTNKTEDKGADTSTSTGTTTVATTTATVKAETKTATDGTKTTTATVDTTTASKIVEKAVENKSEEVVVDTASAATVTETAAGTKTEIALPEQTVKAIAKETEAAVTIKSDAAEVKLDTEAVKAVADQAGDLGTVSLVVETVAQSESKVEVDLKLVTSQGNVTDFKGGSVSVTVKLNTTLAAKPVVCVYIDDNGTYHKVKGVKNADGTFTFETGHFSTYAVMAEEEADKVIAEQTENVEKLMGDLKLKARSVKTEKGNIKVTLTVDEDAIKAIEDLGYTVKYKFYRSTKKAASYKAALEKTGKTYTNTSGKKGTKYYYKARVMVYDAQGALVTKTELKQCKYACRTK